MACIPTQGGAVEAVEIESAVPPRTREVDKRQPFSSLCVFGDHRLWVSLACVACTGMSEVSWYPYTTLHRSQLFLLTELKINLPLLS